MLSTRPAPWQVESWRASPAPPSAQPAMQSRPMLACPDGSFLPLVAKYNQHSNALVFEIDGSLCPDIHVLVQKAGLSSSPSTATWSPKQQVAVPHGYQQSLGGAESRGTIVKSDYQHRLDEIVARNCEREHLKDIHLGYSRDMSILTPHLQPSTSLPDQHSDNKEYCTYWIRTGECDYIQQGCRYKHEMPPLSKLKDIGFTKGFPRWWQDKLQYERPPVRMRHDNSAFRRMLDAHLSSPRTRAPSISEASTSEASGSESDAPKPVVSTVRQRVVVKEPSQSPVTSKITSSFAASPEPEPEPPVNMRRSSRQLPPAPPASHLSPSKLISTDLLDLMSDSECDSLQPPLRVPQNSPETKPSRQGRFVPFNEKSGDVLLPTRYNLRSPSPLMLEAKPSFGAKIKPSTASPTAIKAAPTAPPSPAIPNSTTVNLRRREEIPVGYQGKHMAAANDKQVQSQAQTVLNTARVSPVTEVQPSTARQSIPTGPKVQASPKSSRANPATSTPTSTPKPGLAKSRYATPSAIPSPRMGKATPNTPAKSAPHHPAEVLLHHSTPRGAPRKTRPPPSNKRVVGERALRSIREVKEKDKKVREVEKERESVSLAKVAEEVVRENGGKKFVHLFDAED